MTDVDTGTGQARICGKIDRQADIRIDGQSVEQQDDGSFAAWKTVIQGANRTMGWGSVRETLKSPVCF